MPKKDGICKTYSFDIDIIMMIDELCRKQRRSQTNLIETLVEKEYNEMFGVKDN